MNPRPNLTSQPLRELCGQLCSGETTPQQVLDDVLVAAERLKTSRAHLHFDPASIRWRVDLLTNELNDQASRPPLFGLPVSVKDLMDVVGEPTTCGSSFHAQLVGIPKQDAPFVRLWRSLGGWLAGKTHLNEFAYGITGENPWFGDCTIPGQPGRLTGGSSSGAAASVLGGAACIGLGTDTGGSLRVPAALCGLVSFRSRDWFSDHAGVFPLSGSFDTLGWVQRHVGDVGLVAKALRPELVSEPPTALAAVDGPILEGCDPAVASARKEFIGLLTNAGLAVTETSFPGIERSSDVFAPMQAHEASQNHRTTMDDHRAEYSPAVVSRLDWGRGISRAQFDKLEGERRIIVADWETCFAQHPLLVLPAVPLAELKAGEDQSANRPRILKLTTPASLGRWPVLTLPWKPAGRATGLGFQIIAPRGGEARLVGFAEWFSARFAGW